MRGSLQAGLRPNPEASIDVGGFLGSGVARDVDEKQATLTLSQVLELGGKRDRRVDVAQSDRATLGVEQQTRELDVLAEVTRRFIEVVADQEQINSSRGALQLAERTEKAIAARVRAARTPEAELSRARIAATRARIELRQAQSMLEGAVVISLRCGGARMRVSKEPKPISTRCRPWNPSSRCVNCSIAIPTSFALHPKARLRDAELRLAQAQSRPNLTVSAGLRRFQSTGDVGLVAGFSMPIPMQRSQSGRDRGGAAATRSNTGR